MWECVGVGGCGIVGDGGMCVRGSIGKRTGGVCVGRVHDSFTHA